MDSSCQCETPAVSSSYSGHRQKCGRCQKYVSTTPPQLTVRSPIAYQVQSHKKLELGHGVGHKFTEVSHSCHMEVEASVAQASGNMHIVTLDVGQGESCIVIFADKGMNTKQYVALVDGGFGLPSVIARDALRSLEVKDLDLVVITHFDGDHQRGIFDLLLGSNDRLGGKSLLTKNGQILVRTDDPENVQKTNGKEGLKKLKIKYPGKVVAATAKTIDTQIPGCSVTVLGDHGNNHRNDNEENNGSVALLFRAGTSAYYCAGDLETEVEDSFKRPEEILQVVIKCGHHGSIKSTSNTFLDKWKPAAALVSCGTQKHGHPTSRVIESLADRGIPTVFTNCMYKRAIAFGDHPQNACDGLKTDLKRIAPEAMTNFLNSKPVSAAVNPEVSMTDVSAAVNSDMDITGAPNMVSSAVDVTKALTALSSDADHTTEIDSSDQPSQYTPVCQHLDTMSQIKTVQYMWVASGEGGEHAGHIYTCMPGDGSGLTLTTKSKTHSVGTVNKEHELTIIKNFVCADLTEGKPTPSSQTLKRTLSKESWDSVQSIRSNRKNFVVWDPHGYEGGHTSIAKCESCLEWLNHDGSRPDCGWCARPHNSCLKCLAVDVTKWKSTDERLQNLEWPDFFEPRALECWLPCAHCLGQNKVQNEIRKFLENNMESTSCLRYTRAYVSTQAGKDELEKAQLPAAPSSSRSTRTPIPNRRFKDGASEKELDAATKGKLVNDMKEWFGSHKRKREGQPTDAVSETNEHSAMDNSTVGGTGDSGPSVSRKKVKVRRKRKDSSSVSTPPTDPAPSTGEQSITSDAGLSVSSGAGGSDELHEEEPTTPEMALGALTQRIVPGTILRFEYLNRKIDCIAKVLTVNEAKDTVVADQLNLLKGTKVDATAVSLQTVWKKIGGHSRETVIAPHVVVRVVRMLKYGTDEEFKGGQGDVYAKGYVPDVVGNIFTLTEPYIIVAD